jgi:hypothetical protein
MNKEQYMELTEVININIESIDEIIQLEGEFVKSGKAPVNQVGRMKSNLKTAKQHLDIGMRYLKMATEYQDEAGSK